MNQKHSPKILSAKTVAERLSVSKATLWRMIRAGEFPPAFKISGARKGWLESTVDDWIEERSKVAMSA